MKRLRRGKKSERSYQKYIELEERTANLRKKELSAISRRWDGLIIWTTLVT